MKNCPLCSSPVNFNSFHRTFTCTECNWVDDNILTQVNNIIQDICKYTSNLQLEDVSTDPLKKDIIINLKNNSLSILNQPI